MRTFKRFLACGLSIAIIWVSFPWPAMAQLEISRTPAEAVNAIGLTELPASEMAPLESKQRLDLSSIYQVEVLPEDADSLAKPQDILSQLAVEEKAAILSEQPEIESKTPGPLATNVVEHNTGSSFHSAVTDKLAQVKLGTPGALDTLFEGIQTSKAATANMNASLSLAIRGTGGGTLHYVTTTKIQTIGQGKSASNNERLNLPYNVAVDKNGRIYVTDMLGNAVKIFNRDGTFFQRIGTGHVTRDNDGFHFPIGIAVGPNGYIYVTDLHNHRLQIFYPDRTYFKTIGTGQATAGNDGFNFPQGIAIDKDGHVYVSDTRNDRIQVFDPDGNYLTTIPIAFGPTSIAIDSNGILYVTHKHNHQIEIFNLTRTYNKTIGTERWTASNDGFWGPGGIAVDSEGLIYVADEYNQRVQIFKPDGTYFKTIGKKTLVNDKLKKPEGIALDSAGHIYIADSENHRVEEYSSLQEIEQAKKSRITTLAQTLSEQAQETDHGANAAETSEPSQSAARRFHIDWEAAVGITAGIARKAMPLALAAVVVTAGLLSPGMAHAAMLPLAAHTASGATIIPAWSSWRTMLSFGLVLGSAVAAMPTLQPAVLSTKQALRKILIHKVPSSWVKVTDYDVAYSPDQNWLIVAEKTRNYANRTYISVRPYAVSNLESPISETNLWPLFAQGRRPPKEKSITINLNGARIIATTKNGKVVMTWDAPGLQQTELKFGKTAPSLDGRLMAKINSKKIPFTWFSGPEYNREFYLGLDDMGLIANDLTNRATGMSAQQNSPSAQERFRIDWGANIRAVWHAVTRTRQ